MPNLDPEVQTACAPSAHAAKGLPCRGRGLSLLIRLSDRGVEMPLVDATGLIDLPRRHLLTVP
jgi:hypothetical protein